MALRTGRQVGLTNDPVTRTAGIAVLIPCYNEEQTIRTVVLSFRNVFPHAEIYVYDNNSKDQTGERAAEAGALVRLEPMQGKGHVVRRMFSDIEADAYVMVDGDDTYDAGSAPEMVSRLLTEGLDMVVGCRVDDDIAAYRSGHRFGNLLLTRTVAHLFGSRIRDMLSGYRVFSRRFVKSFPVFAGEFEIETEITIHALNLQAPTAEIDTPYRSRPTGSTSKLRTYRDGFRILSMIFYLLRAERPLLFFSSISALMMLFALFLAEPLFTTYLASGVVPRFPTAILATGLALVSFLSLTCGFILDTVARGRREMRVLSYLAIPRWRSEPLSQKHASN